MTRTFDVDHVLENIGEQDKIALLSGNMEIVSFVYFEILSIYMLTKDRN